MLPKPSSAMISAGVFSSMIERRSSSRQPSLAFAADGSPVVAWIETSPSGASDVRVARFDASANGGAGAWVALGASLGAGGISGTGLADQVRLVNTAAGLVAVWLDDSSGTNQVYARRFDGSGLPNPVYTEAYGQWDLSAGYKVTDKLSLQAEVINLNDGVQRLHGRTKEQVLYVTQTGRRYMLGARYQF